MITVGEKVPFSTSCPYLHGGRTKRGRPSLLPKTELALQIITSPFDGDSGREGQHQPAVALPQSDTIYRCTVSDLDRSIFIAVRILGRTDAM